MIKSRSIVGLTLILILFARLLFGVQQLSLTADEPAHIAGGYALWARGKAAFSLLSQRGYPPLACALESLLIYFSTPNILVEQLEGWPADYDAFTESFVSQVASVKRMAFQARVPVIALTVLLAAVVLRWCTDLWGPTAGLLALGTLVFDPTLLAHGRLATTDAAIVALGTAALYATWRLIDKPVWPWAVGAGVLLGLTMLTKISGFLWIVASSLMILLSFVRRRGHGDNNRLLSLALLALALSLLVLWAGYAFTYGPVHGLSFSIPAPSYLESSRYLVEYESEVFALGQRKIGVWWWYYPLAFAIKNPLPLLIASVIGLVVLLRRPLSRSRLLGLGLFPVLYAGVSLLQGMNIGYRHLLPLHPFLYLMIGGGLSQLVSKGSPVQPIAQQARWKRVLGVLGIWYVVTSVRVYPYEIAYFNELIGGPKNGYRYLVDSNLAWGQSAQAQADYVQAHPSVTADPPATRFHPAPGRYIVNASYLQGIGVDDPYAYEWFRHRDPSDVLHYSLLTFDVPPFEIGWVGECDVPRTPLSRASIQEGIGREDVRIVTLNCTQTWLYLGGATEPGIYALHHDLVERKGWPGRHLVVPRDPFVARHLGRGRLSFEQESDNRGVPFVLYEMEPIQLALDSTVYAVPGDLSPVALGAFEALQSPIALDSSLVFLKAVAYRDGKTLEVDTWWKVTDGPISRPFSILGHLLSPSGELVGRFDGFGLSPLALHSGDVFVQRHRFSEPPVGDAWLRTGVYWQDTMERWTVTGQPEANALLVALDK